VAGATFSAGVALAMLKLARLICSEGHGDARQKPAWPKGNP